MLQLMALALNKNLSPAEFGELSRQVLRNRERLMDGLLERAARLALDQRIGYLAAAMPVVMSL